MHPYELKHEKLWLLYQMRRNKRMALEYARDPNNHVGLRNLLIEPLEREIQWLTDEINSRPKPKRANPR